MMAAKIFRYYRHHKLIYIYLCITIGKKLEDNKWAITQMYKP